MFAIVKSKRLAGAWADAGSAAASASTPAMRDRDMARMPVAWADGARAAVRDARVDGPKMRRVRAERNRCAHVRHGTERDAPRRRRGTRCDRAGVLPRARVART